MLNLNTKDEFSKLVDTYIGFALVRAAVIITVVVTLYNDVTSPNFKQIINYSKKITEYKYTSLGVPVTDNWMVNRIFSAPGIYDTDSVTAVENAFNIQIDPRGEFESYGPPTINSELDTNEVSKFRLKQDSLLKIVDHDLKSTFSLKMSFLSDTTFDMQYWLYFLPVIYFLSLIYVGILSAKIQTVELLETNNSTTENSLTTQKINNYHKYPFIYLKKIFFWIEIVFIVIFIYTYYILFKNIQGFSQEISFAICACGYYSFIYYYMICRCIINDTGINLPNVAKITKTGATLILVWNKLFKIKKVKRYNVVGSIMIISTLFVVMFSKGCHHEGNKVESAHFYSYYNGLWEKHKNLTDKRGRNSYTGFDLLSNFNSTNWNFGKGGRIYNRFFQITYNATLYLTIIASIILLIRIITQKFKNRTQGVLHYFLIFMIFLAIVSNIYYGPQFINLLSRLVCIFICAFLWLYYSKKQIVYSSQNNYSSIFTSLIVITAPFLFISILTYLEFLKYLSSTLYYTVSNSSGFKEFYGMLYIIFLEKCDLFYPFGSILLIIGIYKTIVSHRLNRPQVTSEIAE